jgi:hypothetical protein
MEEIDRSRSEGTFQGFRYFITRGVCHFQCARTRCIWLSCIFGDRRKICLTGGVIFTIFTKINKKWGDKNVFDVPYMRFWCFKCVKYANTASIWSPNFWPCWSGPKIKEPGGGHLCSNRGTSRLQCFSFFLVITSILCLPTCSFTTFLYYSAIFQKYPDCLQDSCLAWGNKSEWVISPIDHRNNIPTCSCVAPWEWGRFPIGQISSCFDNLRCKSWR